MFVAKSPALMFTSYAATVLVAHTAAYVLNETNVLKAKYALQVFSLLPSKQQCHKGTHARSSL